MFQEDESFGSTFPERRTTTPDDVTPAETPGFRVLGLGFRVEYFGSSTRRVEHQKLQTTFGGFRV